MTDFRAQVEALRQRAPPTPDATAAWHTELTAASQVIRPEVFDDSSLRYRADLLRRLKATPHNPAVWRDYLQCLNNDRKQSVKHHVHDDDLCIRMYQALQRLYEHATRLVPMSAANRHSSVYLQLWLDLAALRAEDDLDDANVIFKHLKSHRIGQSLPLFWNAWSDLERRRNNPDRAARFRREAETCAATASTPARNASSSDLAPTPSADRLLSGQRSARRTYPVRPPRRVLNPGSTPVAGKENSDNPSNAYTPVAGHSVLQEPNHERFASQKQGKSPQELATATTLDKFSFTLQSEKKPPLGPSATAVSSPETMRSAQKAPTQSPPHLFSSPDDSPSSGDLPHITSKASPYARPSSEVSGCDQPSSTDSLPRHSRRSFESDRAPDVDHERERERKRQLEREQERIAFDDERQRQLQLRRNYEHKLDLERQQSQRKDLAYARDPIKTHGFQQQYSSAQEIHASSERGRHRSDTEERTGEKPTSTNLRYMSPRIQSHDTFIASTQERLRHGPHSDIRGLTPLPSREPSGAANVHRRGEDHGRTTRRRYSPLQSGLAENRHSRLADENIPPLPSSSTRAMSSMSPSVPMSSMHGEEIEDNYVHRMDERSPPSTKRLLLTKFLGAIQPESLVTVHGKPYLILEMVGKGGSSKVFKVLSSEMRILALKRVKVPRSASLQATIDSYANEIALLRKLKGCSTIIQLYDAEVQRDDGMIQLIMEYGDIDLAKLLSRGKNSGSKINGNFRRVYWQQMLEAVHKIHEARIIHGDLKPANFLIVAGTLKLIDFGIAKAIQAEDTTKIFRDSQVGTPNYMSPEALLCDDEGDDSMEDPMGLNKGRISKPRRYKVGRASDIWSLGCILYQMVYGRAPFAHIKNVMMKLNCIQNPSYEISFPHVDDESVLEVLGGCLQRDPDRRTTIPELLRHEYICLEGNKRRRQTNESGGDLTTTLVDNRVMVGNVVEQLHRRGFDQVVGPRSTVSLRRGDETCETLVNEVAHALPNMTSGGGTGTETGLSGRKDRMGLPLKGLRTPTVSAVTPHTGTHGTEKRYM